MSVSFYQVHIIVFITFYTTNYLHLSHCYFYNMNPFSFFFTFWTKPIAINSIIIDAFWMIPNKATITYHDVFWQFAADVTRIQFRFFFQFDFFCQFSESVALTIGWQNFNVHVFVHERIFQLLILNFVNKFRFDEGLIREQQFKYLFSYP